MHANPLRSSTCTNTRLLGVTGVLVERGEQGSILAEHATKPVSGHVADRVLVLVQRVGAVAGREIEQLDPVPDLVVVEHHELGPIDREGLGLDIAREVEPGPRCTRDPVHHDDGRARGRRVRTSGSALGW